MKISSYYKYCPGLGSNSRPSTHCGFKHGQGVPRPYSLGHGGGDDDDDDNDGAADDDNDADDDDDDDDDDEAHLAVSLGWMGLLRRRHRKAQGLTLSLCTYTPSHCLDGCDHQHWHHSVTATQQV